MLINQKMNTAIFLMSSATSANHTTGKAKRAQVLKSNTYWLDCWPMACLRAANLALASVNARRMFICALRFWPMRPISESCFFSWSLKIDWKRTTMWSTAWQGFTLVDHCKLLSSEPRAIPQDHDLTGLWGYCQCACDLQIRKIATLSQMNKSWC